MPTRSTTSTSSSAPTAATASMADVLKHQLENSSMATIYVPLEGGDVPTEDEIKALEAEGIHAELDAVRGALAVRKATDDEIAAATAPVAEPTPPATSTDNE